MSADGPQHNAATVPHPDRPEGRDDPLHAAQATGTGPRIADKYAPAARVSGARQGNGVVLICEHASAEIPDALADLGLDPADRYSHAVWDIGAMDLSRAMRDALDVPLIVGATSRLVYDCNRPPEAPSAMPERSEVIEVPGNRDLSEADRWARTRTIYEPFSAAVTEVLAAQQVPPAIVTVHTFAPVWHGARRKTEIGLLHDEDSRLALAMAASAPLHTDLQVDLNAPYSASDGVTHTLARFATPARLPSVMIEVRNDLVDSPEKAARVGTQLAEILCEGLTVIGHSDAHGPAGLRR